MEASTQQTEGMTKLTDRQQRILDAARAGAARYGTDTAWQANFVMGRKPSARELKALAAKLDGVEFVSRPYSYVARVGLFGRRMDRRTGTDIGLRFLSALEI